MEILIMTILQLFELSLYLGMTIYDSCRNSSKKQDDNNEKKEK